MKKSIGLVTGCLVSLGVLALAGCAGVRSPEGATGAAVRGYVHGGQQPVSGATVQFYAVGTTGDQSAATPLLSPAVTTDASGNFNIPSSSYTCPSSSALVYLVATGGNPGLGAGGSNPQLVEMAALGQCGNLTNASSIVVNELTTVAAEYALAPYMSSVTTVGSGTSDAAALASAFTLAAQFVDVTYGTSPGVGLPTGMTAPINQIDTIGDIVATCVNSPGGVAGDGSVCGTFFTLTTPVAGIPPTDTASAVLNLANNPTLNTAALYALATPSAPFQPTDATQPSDFSVSLQAAQPALSSSPVVFSPVVIGVVSSTYAADVVNYGAGTAVISGVSISGPNASDFSNTSTCPSIAPNVVCGFNVTFTPSASGMRSANLVIASNDPNSPLLVPLSGTGLTPAPTLRASAMTLGFAPTQVGTGSTLGVTITNLGTAAATLNSISFGGTNAADFAETTTCGSSLAVGVGCSVSVTFTPGALGTRSASLTIASNDPNSPLIVALNGTGGGPVSLSASPTSLTFGSTVVGRSSNTQNVVISNNGSAMGTLSSISFSGTNASDFTDPVGSCGGGTSGSIAAGTACYIGVAFTPHGTGTRTANLVIVSNDPSSPLVVPISGTGTTTYPTLVASPSSLTFPATAVGTTSAAQTITLSNTGTAAATLSGGLSGGYTGQFPIGSTCGGTLAAGSSCSFSVSFQPALTGVQSTTLVITSNDPNSPLNIPISGMGGGVGGSGVFNSNPSSLSFAATVGTTSAVQTAFISISGGSWSLSGIGVIGTNAADFSIYATTCGSSPPLGGSCTVSLTFTPSTIGTEVANLVISGGTTNSPFPVPLSGIGSAPSLTVSPTSLTFGPQGVGTTAAAQSVTVTNISGAAVPVSYISFSGGIGNSYLDFAITNTCGSSIAAGTSCNVSVTFTPSVTGVRSVGLVVVGSGTTLLNVPLSGTGVYYPALSTSKTSLTFSPVGIGLPDLTLSLAVSNTGAGPAILSSIAITGPDSGDFAVTPPNCGSSIAAGSFCYVYVTFTPSGLGTRSANLVISSNDPTSPLVVPLSGTGGTTGSPMLTGSVSSLTFGATTVGTTATVQTFGVGNYGTNTATMGTVSISGANASDFTCTPSPNFIPAGSAAGYTVTFTPSGTGTRSATVMIPSDDPNSPVIITLSGIGQ